jgi:pilus assembly protein TadC
MRSKRMLLAEKKANELPVKMVIPLALGIFPVILMICSSPCYSKIAATYEPLGRLTAERDDKNQRSQTVGLIRA